VKSGTSPYTRTFQAIFDDMLPIILASGSPYRRQLLERLNLKFEVSNPDIDESALHGESPLELVERLALEKAGAVCKKYPNHIIIGSDQVGAIKNKILCKPGDHKKAKTQLLSCSAQKVTFYTGICLINSQSGTKQSSVELFTVTFRKLTPQQIERYLLQDKPYDCAGSFKLEGLGISLFESMSGNDPNALVGLPLIQLITMLNREGYSVP
jgi:7-methyl-GTP pyrophosphatase